MRQLLHSLDAHDHFKKYMRLKEQGTPENDPEYIKAHSLLSKLHQQSAFQKARKSQEQLYRQRQALAQHQHQQQQQPPPINGQVQANGINGILFDNFLFN